MALISAGLAEVYRYLSDVFAYPSGGHLPDWFTLPGKDWPLLCNLKTLAEQRPFLGFGKAIYEITSLEGGSKRDRQQEYQDLFIGKKYPPIWLYESHYVDGRVPGPTTFVVQRLYSQAGLQVAGSELPDHASIEIAFLAHLIEQEAHDRENRKVWQSAQKLFLKNHLMRWLPEVIQRLINSEFIAWATIGHLSQAVFNMKPIRSKTPSANRDVPTITDVHGCSLCGFCVQTCPTRGFSIHENLHTSALWLSQDACNSCGKCITVCPEGVLKLTGNMNHTDKVVLRVSPRSSCPACGNPTISQAEIEYVSRRIGTAEWLVYCLGCRQKISHHAS